MLMAWLEGNSKKGEAWIDVLAASLPTCEILKALDPWFQQETLILLQNTEKLSPSSMGGQRVNCLTKRLHSTKFFNGSIAFTPATFTLVGIPGLEAEHILVSIPFCLMYIIIFLGNCIILHIIQIDLGLHQLMYFFLVMLAFVELGVSASTMPTVLGIFLYGISISLGGCLLPMFSMHFYHHGVRCLSGYVCRLFWGHLQPTALHNHPDNSLHHWDGCHNCLLKCGAHVPTALPPEEPVFLWPQYPHTLLLSLFRSNKLPCGDTHPNSILGLFVVTSTFGLDSLLIVVSYVLIHHMVPGIASGAGQWGVLNICVSHICAVLVYCVPMISLSLLHHFGWHLPPLLQTVMANAYLFFPPVVNPIVYSMKTKEIHNSIVRTLPRKKRGV
ncbi:LOW QUALITY PROTEIN: olfactory receptor 51J1 [Eumetopias jubatus]|uniref:LOW QUALITY PROTEIN: olfactory receptor 51J1 n=1 Tax=Eumetopias jubatus TaxID=34886 RepID=UPI001015D8A8|nr:LOW QUALITY PROTEIN: olfactory receptor 51J1 [Eumetopias jubatus]